MRALCFSIAALACVGASVVVSGCDAQIDVRGDAGPRLDAWSRCEANEDCDDGLWCNGFDRCYPSHPDADARGCVADRRPCTDDEACNEPDHTCHLDCTFPDADWDGRERVACGGDDCADLDPTRYPGNLEICDDASRDEDCDATTFGDRDVDGDGFVDARCCNRELLGEQTCGTDCDDSNRYAYPGAPERCDGRDDDCDARIDEGVVVGGFVDADRDGYGDPRARTGGCPGQAGFTLTGGDCDDAARHRYPGAPEICDLVDDDCDGVIDEHAVEVPWYPDADGDGFGDPAGAAVLSCVPLAGRSRDGADCDDADRRRSPIAPERCNGIDDDCDGRASFEILPGDFEDDDGDGVADASCGGLDCDDRDPLTHAGAHDFVDGRDNDCDGRLDEDGGDPTWYRDDDGDGFGDERATMIAPTRPPGYAARGGDCDDTSASDHPGAPELCDDGDDDDCDGRVDESAAARWVFRDADGDGYGRDTEPLRACLAPPGYSQVPGDCADDDARRHPGGREICDGLDDDCDGATDEGVQTVYFVDADGDGHGDPASTAAACGPQPGLATVGDDCDDTSDARYPGARELCDGSDDDCDGDIDEWAARTFYRDADGDGHGDPGRTTVACTAPSGYVATGDDCDDACAACRPGAAEVCDGANNDCDASIDEGVRQTYFRDRDGDGFGSSSSGSLVSCTAPSGYVTEDGDCDDADATRAPGMAEACDLVDEDCDGAVDEGCLDLPMPP